MGSQADLHIHFKPSEDSPVRLLLAVLLSGGVFVATAPSATACLWDKEVVGHEKQFKSSYIEHAAPNSTEPPHMVQRIGSSIGVLGGVGVLMLAGAMLVGVVRHREASKRSTSENTP
ncbi:MAG: hypothetical protein C0467_05455 [Planctomycetaceae bacterium]|nr:hypothetical protein [Planctomycetaceae bacterium]